MSARSKAAALAARLRGEGPPILLDGATGTELEREGLATGLPLWSTHALLEAPEVVGAIHARHRAAGAELITANTFRTARYTLARAGLGDQDRRLTRLAVDLARAALESDAADPVADGWVAGSLAPLEDCYEPGRVPPDRTLAREHGRQADLLGEAGVDLILVETMNCAREAEQAASAAARTGLPFAVGLVSWAPGEILSGESLADVAARLVDLGAAAVGVNCVPPSSLEASRASLVRLGVPLLVSPNLGEPEATTGFARREDVAPEGFAACLHPWLACPQLRIVGGCCGTTPAHLGALAGCLSSEPVRPSERRRSAP